MSIILEIPVQSTTPRFRHQTWCGAKREDRSLCVDMGCVSDVRRTTTGSVSILGGITEDGAHTAPRVAFEADVPAASTTLAETIEHAAALLHAVLEVTPVSIRDTTPPAVDFSKVVANITTRSTLETLCALADALAGNLADTTVVGA